MTTFQRNMLRCSIRSIFFLTGLLALASVFVGIRLRNAFDVARDVDELKARGATVIWGERQQIVGTRSTLVVDLGGVTFPDFGLKGDWSLKSSSALQIAIG